MSVGLLVGVCLASASNMLAKEPNRSVVHDGSAQERAIIVTEPESRYVHWEYQYLDKHFPGRSFPMEHALVTDEPKMRAWDLHTFMWRGRKTEFWFDITQQFREFSKKHPEIK
jgi:hypothetical protein